MSKLNPAEREVVYHADLIANLDNPDKVQELTGKLHRQMILTWLDELLFFMSNADAVGDVCGQAYTHAMMRRGAMLGYQMNTIYRYMEHMCDALTNLVASLNPPFDVTSNDDAYLARVEKYYELLYTEFLSLPMDDLSKRSREHPAYTFVFLDNQSVECPIQDLALVVQKNELARMIMAASHAVKRSSSININ